MNPARPASAAARRRASRYTILLSGLAIAALLMVLDVSTGAASVGLREVWHILTGGQASSAMAQLIVWDLRLPQTLMALCAGAALGLAGAEMQTVLDNPLASPFTLGVSSAAATGAALALVLGWHLPALPMQYAVAANAFLMAALCSFLLDLAARRMRMAAHGIVLLGIALVFGFNAVVALLQLLSNAAALQDLLHWMMGSVSNSGWPEVFLLAIVFVLAFAASVSQAWRLTALRFGEERAGSFGIDTRQVRRWALLRVSVVSGTVVALIGVIGFVGLIAPHIARRLVGEDHRWYLPASALAGALIMLGASVLAKGLSNQVEIPAGIVTTLVGIPFFILVLARRNRH